MDQAEIRHELTFPLLMIGFAVSCIFLSLAALVVGLTLSPFLALGMIFPRIGQPFAGYIVQVKTKTSSAFARQMIRRSIAGAKKNAG